MTILYNQSHKFHNTNKLLHLAEFFKELHRFNSPPEVYLGSGVPKICSKFTGKPHVEV